MTGSGEGSGTIASGWGAVGAARTGSGVTGSEAGGGGGGGGGGDGDGDGDGDGCVTSLATDGFGAAFADGFVSDQTPMPTKTSMTAHIAATQGTDFLFPSALPAGAEFFGAESVAAVPRASEV